MRNAIIMGDLNGHVGTNRQGIARVIGEFSIGDRNPEGERVIDLCMTRDLSIMNTFYKHKGSHKWTWYQWNGRIGEYTNKSMIDLMLSNNKKIFLDVKTISSASTV